MSAFDDDLHKSVLKWQKDLVVQPLPPRQINFDAALKTAISFVKTQDELWTAVSTGKPLYLRPSDEDSIQDFNPDEAEAIPANDETDKSALYTKNTMAQLSSAVASVRSNYSKQFQDAGIENTYLTFGLLRWQTVDGKTYKSPLLFVPVALEASRGHAARMRLDDGEIHLNIALGLRFHSEFGLELPEVIPDQSFSVSKWLDQVQPIAAKRGWDVAGNSYLSNFNFQHEAMYRDIEANLDSILGSELVRGLVAHNQTDASVPNAAVPFAEASDIDAAAPPEDSLDILPSDSSQRVCIDAVRNGKSFVMQGPPGTGKTQTIANMMGNLIHDGHSVLFVSEKKTALDAVRLKLAHHGLDDYTLALHGKEMKKADFAKALASAWRAVESRGTGRARPHLNTPTQARAARELLTSYADAVNEVLPSWEMSFSQLVGLATAGSPRIRRGSASLGNVLVGLDKPSVAKIREAIRYAGDCWPVLAPPQESPWWGLHNTSAVVAVLDPLASSLRALAALQSQLTALPALTSDPQSLQQLLKALEDAGQFPLGLDADDVPLERLSALATSVRRLASLTADLRELAEASTFDLATARNLASSIPSDWADRIRPIPGQNSLTAVRQHASDMEFAASQVRKVWEVAPELAKRFGVAEVRSWQDILGLFEQLTVADTELRPSWYWFRAGEANRAKVHELKAHVQAALNELSEAESAAGHYARELLLLDTASIRSDLTTGPVWARRFRSGTRRAIRDLAATGAPVRDCDTGLSAIHAAESLRTAKERLNDLANNPLLASYQQISEPMWPAILAALELASSAAFDGKVRISPYLVADITSPLFHEGPQPLAEDPKFQDGYAAISYLRSVRDTWLLAALIDHPLEAVSTHIESKANALAEVAALEGLLRTVREVGTVHDLRTVLTAIESMVKAGDEIEALQATLVNHIDVGDETLVSECASALERVVAAVDYLPSSLILGDLRQLLESPGLKSTLAAALQSLTDLRECFDTDVRDTAFGDLSPLAIIEDRVMRMASALADLPKWEAHLRSRIALREAGLSEPLASALDARVAGDSATTALWAVVASALVESRLADEPRFRHSVTDALDSRVREYRELDVALQAGASGAIRDVQDARIRGLSAQARSGFTRYANAGPRARLPRIVDQIASLGDDLKVLKPVMMMNPLSVSKYLPPDMKFDYVIYDEASQLLPGHAITSLYRGDCVVIAGDPKQMPPPRYGAFEEEIPDEDEKGSDIPAASDYESVLTLAMKSPVFDERMLLWHYRSRNEALIAFSNAEFYDSRLYTFPSCRELAEDPGVTFYPVPQGRWIPSSGGMQGRNPIEAGVIVEEVRLFAAANPPGRSGSKSLMVVAPGKGQLDEIEGQLAAARRKDVALDKFMAEAEGDAGLLLKTLETVQGDERDVVFFSFAYNNRDASGRVKTYFGPLINPGGERRFNVAITRAREKLVLFSGVRAGDIADDPSKTALMVIRRYLDFAERGVSALSFRGATNQVMPESPFEDSVIEFLRSHNYTVVPQVGTAAYRIDIGVIHPRFPGAFMLGIECDGYQYHAAPAARDRDRIRQDVLEGLGWTLHRIWGTQWYRNTSEQKKLLLERLQHQESLDPVGLMAPEGHVAAR